MTQNTTTEPRWPLAGHVRIKGPEHSDWRWEKPDTVTLDDDPFAWLETHPKGDFHDELLRQAKALGCGEKLYFRVDETGLETSTERDLIEALDGVRVLGT